MAMYCSAADVKAVLAPELLDGGGDPFPDTSEETAAQLIDSQIDTAVGAASVRIDTYLRARYAVPVAPLDPDTDPLTYPDVARWWARDLAAYDATLTLLRGQPIGPDDPVRLRATQALSELASVRDGKMDAGLPSDVDTPSDQEGYAGVVASGSAGMFDQSDWGGTTSGWFGVTYTPPTF